MPSLSSDSQWFIICSKAQAASPKASRPTMRLEPFSVWKPRRMVVIASRSSGALRTTPRFSSMASSTSAASSRKISCSSASSADSSTLPSSSTPSGRAGSAASGATSACTLSGAVNARPSSAAGCVAASATGCDGSSNASASPAPPWPFEADASAAPCAAATPANVRPAAATAASGAASCEASAACSAPADASSANERSSALESASETTSSGVSGMEVSSNSMPRCASKRKRRARDADCSIVSTKNPTELRPSARRARPASLSVTRARMMSSTCLLMARQAWAASRYSRTVSTALVSASSGSTVSRRFTAVSSRK